MTTELRTEEKVIKEIKSPSGTWKLRLIRRGDAIDGIYIQYVSNGGLSVHEARLYDLVRLIDSCGANDCNGMWYRRDSGIDPFFEYVVRVVKFLPIGEVPGMYVGHLEQIYSLCYRRKFYRIYIMHGGIWGDYRLWIIISPPINNEMGEKWCSYCRSEFC